jgi:hypothetical protein
VLLADALDKLCLSSPAEIRGNPPIRTAPKLYCLSDQSKQ